MVKLGMETACAQRQITDLSSFLYVFAVRPKLTSRVERAGPDAALGAGEEKSEPQLVVAAPWGGRWGPGASHR